MSKRFSLVPLVAGLLLVACGCSGGGSDSEGEQPSESSPAPASSAPAFSKFADLPGKEQRYNYMGDPLSLRVKAVDSMWTGELAGRPAKEGEHYLAVYLAVTGVESDRGVNDASLRGLELRITDEAHCRNEIGQSDTCRFAAYPLSQLETVADNTWREHAWQEVMVGGTNIEQGATVIGVVGFSVPDTTEATDVALCSPDKEHPMQGDDSLCVPLKAPARS